MSIVMMYDRVTKLWIYWTNSIVETVPAADIWGDIREGRILVYVQVTFVSRRDCRRIHESNSQEGYVEGYKDWAGVSDMMNVILNISWSYNVNRWSRFIAFQIEFLISVS